MHILFYGYGSHAKKLKKCCEDFFRGSIKLVFSGINRKKNNSDIKIFSSIEEAIAKNGFVDCVFISANNQYHLDIFKKCIVQKINYIYVEKPALGVQEFFENSSKDKFKDIKYIQVGYHMTYLEPFIRLREIINNKEFGELIRLDIFSGHGLAFKKDFKKSWRANDKDALFETVLSHFINLIIYFENLQNFNDFIHISKKNEKHNLTDTEHIAFTNQKGTLFNVSVSWGSPLEKFVKAYFSNGIWEYDFKNISLKYPRDNFDENGFFTSPKIIKENLTSLGIQPSVFYFLDKVKNDVQTIHEFNNSFQTSYLLKKIKS